MPKFNSDPVGKPTFRPQFPLRPDDLRRMYEQSDAVVRSSAVGEDCDQGAGMGLQIGGELLPDAYGFWARLYAPPLNAAIGPALYSFLEVEDDGTGVAWLSPPSALRGI